MPATGHSNRKPTLGKRPLDYVAFWQFLGFVMLICIIWVNEVLDLPKLIYGDSSGEFNYVAACVLTAAVIIVGFITIAHTILLQRRMLKGFVTICSYCGRVHIDENAWQQVEEFVSTRTSLEFSHGVCPVCYQKAVQDDHADPSAAPGRR
jgi:hypothetical protein